MDVGRDPFRRQDGLRCGLTPDALRGPRFRRLFTGVYVAAEVPVTPGLWARAGLLVLPPGAFASHATAARLYGVPIPTLAEEHFSVRRAQDRRRAPGMRCHVCPQPVVVSIRGLPVSSPEQLFVELASLVGLVDLVVVGDALVRRGLTSPEKLKAFCAATSLPCEARAAEAAAYVRDDVDSPMETRLRMLLVLPGLPEPRINLKIRDVDGTPLTTTRHRQQRDLQEPRPDGRTGVETAAPTRPPRTPRRPERRLEGPLPGTLTWPLSLGGSPLRRRPGAPSSRCAP